MSRKSAMTPTTRLTLGHLRHVGSAHTVPEIATAIDASPRTVRVTVNKLVRAKVLERTLLHHTAYFRLPATCPISDTPDPSPARDQTPPLAISPA
jgi:hypothetical protein